MNSHEFEGPFAWHSLNDSKTYRTSIQCSHSSLKGKSAYFCGLALRSKFALFLDLLTVRQRYLNLLPVGIGINLTNINASLRTRLQRKYNLHSEKNEYFLRLLIYILIQINIYLRIYEIRHRQPAVFLIFPKVFF